LKIPKEKLENVKIYHISSSMSISNVGVFRYVFSPIRVKIRTCLSIKKMAHPDFKNIFQNKLGFILLITSQEQSTQKNSHQTGSLRHTN